MTRSVDVQAVIDRVNRAAVSRPNWTVAGFLFLTVAFAAGMPLVSTGDGGTGIRRTRSSPSTATQTPTAY